MEINNGTWATEAHRAFPFSLLATLSSFPASFPTVSSYHHQEALQNYQT